MKPSEIRKHCPQFVLGFKTWYDLPSRIGDVPFQYGVNVEILVYYAVKKGKRFTYWYYCLYHHYDPKAMHPHDFQGVMMVYDEDDKFVCSVSVSHLDLLVYDRKRDARWKPIVNVEAGSHAMRPVRYLSDLRLWTSPYITVYPEACKFISLQSSVSKRDWPVWQDMFDGDKPGYSVNMPDRWFDRRSETWAEKHPKEMIEKTGKRTSRRFFWDEPDNLLWLLQRVGKLSKEIEL